MEAYLWVFVICAENCCRSIRNEFFYFSTEEPQKFWEFMRHLSNLIWTKSDFMNFSIIRLSWVSLNIVKDQNPSQIMNDFIVFWTSSNPLRFVIHQFAFLMQKIMRSVKHSSHDHQSYFNVQFPIKKKKIFPSKRKVEGILSHSISNFDCSGVILWLN